MQDEEQDEHEHEAPVTHGQLMRVVHRWCVRNDAELLGLGLERQDGVAYWRAEVRLQSGQRAEALGMTGTEVLHSLGIAATRSSN